MAFCSPENRYALESVKARLCFILICTYRVKQRIMKGHDLIVLMNTSCGILSCDFSDLSLVMSKFYGAVIFIVIKQTNQK